MESSLQRQLMCINVQCYNPSQPLHCIFILILAHGIEVEMQDNWYETAISASAPHKVISVVDWASDSLLPMPEARIPAIYSLLAWNINDPSVGNRSLNKEKI